MRRLRASPIFCVLAAVLAACQAQTGSLATPTIAQAGLVASATSDGTTLEIGFVGGGQPVTVQLSGLRLVTGGWGGKLIILGSDTSGRFLAAFNPQDGTPAGCYVDNAQGIDRGEFIELQGILWHKTADVASATSQPATGQAYPGGTRFCFDPSGSIWQVVPA